MDFCRRQNWPYSFFALVFWNKMHHHHADTCINSSTNCSTSCKKMVKIGPEVFEWKWGRKWKLCCDLAKISRFSFIWHTGVLKRIGISQFWFYRVNRQSFLHNLWKFGEIRICASRVLSERSCMAGVDTAKLAYLTEYLNNYWTNLHQRFSCGRGMHADYKLT